MFALLGIVALTGTAACTSSDDPAAERADTPSTSTAAPVPTGPAPELVDAPCADPGTPADGRISCQVLVLPEDRAHPEDRQVELPVLTVRSPGAAAEPAADGSGELSGELGPVVYLHGGPGGGAVDRWATWSTLVDSLGTDLVVYDQRGGGAAVPRLECPDHDLAVVAALSAAGEPSEERAAVGRALGECHDQLRDAGIDLDRYDVATSVADLDDLRRALGVERLRLVASSSGTRLALEYAATHPDHVSALALDSIDLPGAGYPGRDAEQVEPAIERLLDTCAGDAACNSAHPDLAASLETAVARADTTPIVIDLPAADGRPAGRLVVTGADLRAGLFAALYDSELVPLLPLAIESVAAGDDTLLASVGPRLAPALSGGATGALLSANCAALHEPTDPGPGDGAADVPDGSSTVALTGWDLFCDRWPVRASESVAADLDPEVPVLVVGGELDPITPADDSRRAARRWDATYVEVPRAGHAPMLIDPCARSVLRSFLADPSAPDLACTATATPPPFA